MDDLMDIMTYVFFHIFLTQRHCATAWSFANDMELFELNALEPIAKEAARETSIKDPLNRSPEMKKNSKRIYFKDSNRKVWTIPQFGHASDGF